MALIQRPLNDTGTILLIGGGFTAIFGLIIGLLALFVIPSACSFVGSLQLAILGLLFLGGLFVFLFGLVLSRIKAKPK